MNRPKLDSVTKAPTKDFDSDEAKRVRANYDEANIMEQMEIEPFSLPAEYCVVPNRHAHEVTKRGEKAKIPSIWDQAVQSCSISAFKPTALFTAQQEDQCMTPAKGNNMGTESTQATSGNVIRKQSASKF